MSKAFLKIVFVEGATFESHWERGRREHKIQISGDHAPEFQRAEESNFSSCRVAGFFGREKFGF